TQDPVDQVVNAKPPAVALSPDHFFVCRSEQGRRMLINQVLQAGKEDDAQHLFGGKSECRRHLVPFDILIEGADNSPWYAPATEREVLLECIECLARGQGELAGRIDVSIADRVHV